MDLHEQVHTALCSCRLKQKSADEFRGQNFWPQGTSANKNTSEDDSEIVQNCTKKSLKRKQSQDLCTQRSATKQEHTCATQTPGRSDTLNLGCWQQSTSAGQTNKHLKNAEPQQSVEPMIPSESAQKQMTYSLQRKANNDTHAKFLSHRNFKSGGGHRKMLKSPISCIRA